MERKIIMKQWMKRMMCLMCAVGCLMTQTFAYDRASAIKYSDDKALHPSSGYNFYKDKDCANFVSQCLYSGKMKQDKVWYTTKKLGKFYGSNAWVNADALKNYLKNNVGAKKLGSWTEKGTSGPYPSYAYVDNSANLTASNTGKVVVFYDWTGDGEMDHSALYVVDNADTSDKILDGDVKGDLINSHTKNRYHVIWHRNKANETRDTTRIYAFELKG